MSGNFNLIYCVSIHKDLIFISFYLLPIRNEWTNKRQYYVIVHLSGPWCVCWSFRLKFIGLSIFSMTFDIVNNNCVAFPSWKQQRKKNSTNCLCFIHWFMANHLKRRLNVVFNSLGYFQTILNEHEISNSSINGYKCIECP